MSKALLAPIVWYPLYLVPAGASIFIAWLTNRKEIKINVWDLLLLILPWMLWIGLNIMNGTGKSLANLIEPVGLGLLAGFLFILRCLSRHTAERKISMAILFFVSLCAVLAWAFIPALHE